MLTALSVIAKVVTFVVEKAAPKLAALPFDKRRKACRALTKLYFSVQALHESTSYVLETFDDFRYRGDGEGLFNALNNHSRDIELASNMFIQLSFELENGLEVIDPALAKCCHLLYWGKFDFLSYLSDSIGSDRSGPTPRKIIKRPRGRMMEVDYEDLYKQSQRGLDAKEPHFWPSSALDDFTAEFEDVPITFEDNETAGEIHGMIVAQHERLRFAMDQLRSLIKSSFNIEEVLFLSDKHPWR